MTVIIRLALEYRLATVTGIGWHSSIGSRLLNSVEVIGKNQIYWRAAAIKNLKYILYII